MSAGVICRCLAFAGALVGVSLVTACGGADERPSTSSATGSKQPTKAGMQMSGNTGMGMGAKPAVGRRTVTTTRVDGTRVVPITTLASRTWQGMRITVQARTPVPFEIFNGSRERETKPTSRSSFHLMVMLSDAETGVALPYAGVWATISRARHVVYDERQWPMISRYMGPHYGDNVTLPANGTYKLSLLVSPPVSARHIEYAHVWLKPHRTSFTFHWRSA